MTGTGTQADPYIPTTWAEFVTAIGSSSAYVSVPEDTVWDLAELYPNGISASITWSCYNVQGNALEIKNLKFTGSNAGFAYPSSSSFIRRSVYDIIFTDLQLENGSHFILQPSYNGVWLNFDCYDCDFQGTVTDSVFDLSLDTTTRATKYRRCLFDLDFSGNSTLFQNGGSTNQYTHAELYWCNLIIDGKMTRNSQTKIGFYFCLWQGECAVTGLYFATSNDDTSKYSKESIINAVVPSGYSITTQDSSNVVHTLINSDKVESGATIHSAFTQVTDSQLKNADYLLSLGFSITTENTLLPYEDALWRITSGVNGGYPYNLLLPLGDLPSEVRLRLGGLKFKKTTETEYGQMTDYDPDTVYILVGSNNIWNESVDNKLGANQIKGIYCGDELIWATYKRVEYIQSTGTQYILTDIIPSTTDKTVLDLKFGRKLNDGSAIDANYFRLYGVRGYAIKFAHWDNNNGTSMDFYLGYNWSSDLTQYAISNPSNITTRQYVTAKRGACSYGGKTCSANATVTEVPQGGAVVFGYDNSKTTFAYKGFEVYLYGTKIYSENESLLHDLIPVERQPDGKLGLYDTITDKFYANAGTGVFEKGDYI